MPLHKRDRGSLRPALESHEVDLKGWKNKLQWWHLYLSCNNNGFMYDHKRRRQIIKSVSMDEDRSRVELSVSIRVLVLNRTDRLGGRRIVSRILRLSFAAPSF